MSRSWPIVSGTLALTIALLSPTHATFATELRTAEEIDECIKDNYPSDTSIQSIDLVTKDRVGNANRMEAKMYWARKDGRSKVLMKFNQPADLRGSALLMLEQEERNDMFMYLPELKKTRRVTSRMMNGSMFGTDFSYEEFQRLQGMADDLSSERLPDEEVGSRPSYVVSHVPAPDSGSEYERIISYVDKQTCVSVRTDFVKKGDRTTKRATSPFESVSNEAGSWVPRKMVMTNLVEGTETAIEVTELEMGAKIPRAYFSQSKLDRMGH